MRLRPLAPYLAIALAGTALAVLFAPQYENAETLRPYDYVQYWSAGRAVRDGQNPYDGNVLFQYQQQIEATGGDPVMMWNPPWTLPLAMALGSFHWRTGQLLWIAVNLGAVLASAALLWRSFGGERGKTILGVALGLAFGPTLFTVFYGQISGLLLLGVAGFLACTRGQRPALAGVFLALTAIKPHLLAPFALVLALEAIRSKPMRTTLATGVLVLAGSVGFVLLWNPDVWSQYRASTLASSSNSHLTLNDWTHPTLGYLLKESIPGQPRFAMFLPLMVALPAVAVYWWNRRSNWVWAVELPRLVLVSLLAAPYGAWSFDLVLLLVPVLHAFVWLSQCGSRTLWIRACIGYGLLNVGLFATLYGKNCAVNFWLTPVVLVGYLFFGWLARGLRRPAPAPVLTNRIVLNPRSFAR